MHALAKRYRLGPDALGRHSRNHLPPQLRAKLVAGPDIEGLDLDRLRDTESQSLLANIIALRQRLFASLDIAEEAGDAYMTTRVTAQLHKNFELTGSLLGDLGAGRTTINNVLVLPAYVELRAAMVRALAPFPEARRAVAAALNELETRAAEAMRADTRELAGATRAASALIEHAPLGAPPC